MCVQLFRTSDVEFDCLPIDWRVTASDMKKLLVVAVLIKMIGYKVVGLLLVLTVVHGM